MSHGKGDASLSVAEKLEHLFKTLNREEQAVVGDLVRSALLHAADQFDPAKPAVPEFVNGLTGKVAPALVGALRLPGSLAAHSIPGCNAAALAALRPSSGKVK